MSEIINHIALDAGRAIPGARSDSQLDMAVTPLLSCVDPNIEGFTDTVDRWQKAFPVDGDRHKFSLGEAREAAIPVGVAALLWVDFPDTGQPHLDQLTEAVESFKTGLINGGMGKGVTKALIAREVFTRAEASLDQSSYAAYNNANALEELAYRIGVDNWRDRLFFAMARSSHSRRYCIKPSVARQILASSKDANINPS